ncbi:MAG: hypothetical protein WCK28_03205 [Burkholderiales bacterium]|jgi:hypothetical protein
MRSRLLVCLALAPVFTGCASIVSGQNQPVSVETRVKGEMVAGASCTMTNDKGKWFVTTPGTTTVQRSYTDLSVNCEKGGAVPGLATVKSTTKPMAFGNLLFGGVIGAGVDVATGAAYDYPSLITVEMGSSGVVAPVPSTAVPDATATATADKPAAPR